MSARIGKQLQIITPNRVGMFSEVAGAVADAGVNIDSLCAYAMGKKAYFLMVTNDNARAGKVLKAKKFQVKEEKVVLVELDNRVGSASEMAQKLRDKKVNLSYIYGTTCGCGGPSLLVFKSNKDAKAVDALA